MPGEDKQGSKQKRDQDVLKEITQDTASSEDLKKSAQGIDDADNRKFRKEMRIETLIKEKGFKDVVVLFGSDGSVDVVVKTPSLTSVQVAQIANITSRHADVDIRYLCAAKVLKIDLKYIYLIISFYIDITILK